MSKFKTQYKSSSHPALTSLTLHNVGHEACDPLHAWSGIREFYSVHTVVAGRGTYQVGELSFALQAGDSFLIYPNTLVRYQADGTEPWEYLWLGISGLTVKNMIDFTSFSPENPCIYQKDRETQENTLQSALESIYLSQGHTLADEVRMVGLTYVFLSQLMGEESGQATDQGAHYAQKARDFIHRNYTSGITPQQVAHKVNISRSHLHRVFTQEFGMSVGKYINQLQMERGGQLLRTTDLSIGAVSNSVGFENQLYFSKVFKQKYNLSPSAYRKLGHLQERKRKPSLEDL